MLKEKYLSSTLSGTPKHSPDWPVTFSRPSRKWPRFLFLVSVHHGNPECSHPGRASSSTASSSSFSTSTSSSLLNRQSLGTGREQSSGTKSGRHIGAGFRKYSSKSLATIYKLVKRSYKQFEISLYFHIICSLICAFFPFPFSFIFHQQQKKWGLTQSTNSKVKSRFLSVTPPPCLESVNFVACTGRGRLCQSAATWAGSCSPPPPVALNTVAWAARRGLPLAHFAPTHGARRNHHPSCWEARRRAKTCVYLAWFARRSGLKLCGLPAAPAESGATTQSTDGAAYGWL